jgi:hypothetical protein
MYSQLSTNEVDSLENNKNQNSKDKKQLKSKKLLADPLIKYGMLYIQFLSFLKTLFIIFLLFTISKLIQDHIILKNYDKSIEGSH